MTVQPDDSNVIVICRAYYKLKQSPGFKRRITWIEKYPKECGQLRHNALVEYTGTFPLTVETHGNLKGPGSEYVRRNPSQNR